MGGRGSSGKQGRAGGSGTAQHQRALNQAFRSSPGMQEYNVYKALEDMPVGTTVSDGSKTITDTQGGEWRSVSTSYTKTSQYGWTKFGDTNNYDEIASNRLAKQLTKSKSKNFKVK